MIKTSRKPPTKVAVWENIGNVRLSKEVRLSRILPWCLESGGVDTILVTSGQSFRVSTKGEMLEGSHQRAVDPTTRRIFGENLIARFQARGWPGTKVINSRGRVYVAAFDGKLAAKMAKIENSLFEWLNVGSKHLPEDICVFRRGAKFPVFISVTHEREAWVISETCPPGFAPSDLRLDQLNIWPGKYFCRV